jgi:hypothetical protein
LWYTKKKPPYIGVRGAATIKKCVTNAARVGNPIDANLKIFDNGLKIFTKSAVKGAKGGGMAIWSKVPQCGAATA